MKKAILVAIVSICIATVGCKKNDNNDPATATELITSTSWKIDTAGFDMDKNGEIDAAVPDGFETCDLDNTITFSSDSTGVFDEGALKCEGAEQSTPFTWALEQNDQVIDIQGDVLGELQGKVNILTLTNTSFILSKNIVSSFPIPFNGNLIIALKK